MVGGGINYWLLPLPSNSLHKERRRRGSEPRPLGIDWRPGLAFHSQQPRRGDTFLSRSKIGASISGLQIFLTKIAFAGAISFYLVSRLLGAGAGPDMKCSKK